MFFSSLFVYICQKEIKTTIYNTYNMELINRTPNYKAIQAHESAKEIDNNNIEPEVKKETEQESRPELEAKKTRNKAKSDSMRLYMSELADDFEIKKSFENSDVVDFLKLTTSSATIKDLEKEKRQENKQDKGKELINISDKEKPEDKEYTEKEDKEEDKKNDKIKITKDEIEFGVFLLISGLDFAFTKGMRMIGRQAETTENQRKRLIAVYTRGIDHYNITVSPLWLMIISTLIIYGYTAYKSDKIEDRQTENKQTEQPKKEYKSDFKEDKKEDSKEDKESDKTYNDDSGISEII